MTRMELVDITLTTGGVTRVRNVSAHVSPGRLIAIVGANGSGKSSLLGLMAGQLTPSSGQVLLDDRPLGSLTPRLRARCLAWLGQSISGAEAYAVRDVVNWGRISQSRDNAATRIEPADVIDDLRLAHLANAPMGSLSGGERQRAHIARVWVQAAPITLLDEADASLDEDGRILLRRLVTEKVSGGHSIVIVTHDRGWAANAADEVWVMDAGGLTIH